MTKIKRVLRKREANTEEVEYFNSIKEAAESVDTKMDNWKVQMLINAAIDTGKRAFKYNWYKV